MELLRLFGSKGSSTVDHRPSEAREIIQRIPAFKASGLERQEYCSDPANGLANTATYTLLDVLRGVGIIPVGKPDHDHIFSNPSERLIAVNIQDVEPSHMSDILGFTKLIAQQYDVQAMMENGGDTREAEQPEILDEAKISWVLTYQYAWWPRAILFVPKSE